MQGDLAESFGLEDPRQVGWSMSDALPMEDPNAVRDGDF